MLGALVLGLVLAAPGAGAQEKTYTFPEVRIEATILPDGTLELVERRTFDFTGSFSFAYFTVDWPTHLIEDFAVSSPQLGPEPLVVTTEVDPATGGFKGTWYFSAANRPVTFEISYRARCAVDVYADTAHLLWQFVGTGWDRTMDSVHVTLHVPGRAAEAPPRPVAECDPREEIPEVATEPLSEGDVRAWGHGPLGGEVGFADPQTVTFDIRRLPAETFVEGSVVFPAESVPLAFRSPETKRAEIMAEEARLADEANALRRRYLGARRTSGRLLVIVPLVLLGLAGAARLRDRVPGVPRHLEEPPERIHPGELAYLWSAYRKRPSPKNAYRAQLLHLARKGVIKIEAVGRVSDPQDLRVERGTKPTGRLDREFADFLLGTRRQRRLKELQAGGKSGKALRSWFDELKDRTEDSVHRLTVGGIRAEAWLMALVTGVVLLWAAGTVGIAGTIVAATGGLVGGAVLRLLTGRARGALVGLFLAVTMAGVLIPAAIALLTIGPGIEVPFARVLVSAGVTTAAWVLALRFTPERLPAELRERMARWAAFRRFLRRFSSLPDAPAMAVLVWERYLVLATALGVAGRVAKQVRALAPAGDLPAPIPGIPAGAGGIDWVRGFDASPVPATAFGQFVTTSSDSSFSSGAGSFISGGGGGGGFSGGGGGGGGGTGGGAG